MYRSEVLSSELLMLDPEGASRDGNLEYIVVFVIAGLPTGLVAGWLATVAARRTGLSGSPRRDAEGDVQP